MAPKDVYNMDEIGWFYRAQPTKIVQGKVCERKIQMDHLTHALVVNTTGIEQVETCDY